MAHSGVVTIDQNGAAPAGGNWAGNLTYRASALHEPATVDELAALVRDRRHVRALGSRHSFNDLADTDGVLVSLAGLPSVVEIDEVARTVRVSAGLRHGDLAPAIEAEGWALANLASLPHISVAGAVQTGTHGSGDHIGSLASQVAAVEFVTAGGEQSRLVRGDTDFGGAVVALGALGIVTHVTLDIEPTYTVAQTVFEGVTWDAALADLDALTGAGDSVSLFTTWRDSDRIDQVWVKSRDGRGADALASFGGVPVDGPRHPLPGIDPTPCTEQGGVPGAWFDRLPHFRLAFTPSNGDELQSEYLLPRADAVASIEAVRSLAPRIAPLLQVCEVRTMRGDDLWVSPAHGGDTVALHFTWLPDVAGVSALLPALEAALPATARPHWGKLFTLDAGAIRERYPRWADFADLRDRLDPERRFGNAYLERLGL